MIITICGSIDATPKIIEIKDFLERKGHKVTIPHYSQKILDKEVSLQHYIDTKEKSGDITIRQSQNVDFFMSYFDKIKESDAILVVNEKKRGIEHYIGGNTLIEMGFAYVLKKKIFILNDIPARSERMHYVDEIVDLKPIVLKSDLNNLK